MTAAVELAITPDYNRHYECGQV